MGSNIHEGHCTITDKENVKDIIVVHNAAGKEIDRVDIGDAGTISNCTESSYKNTDAEGNEVEVKYLAFNVNSKEAAQTVFETVTMGASVEFVNIETSKQDNNIVGTNHKESRVGLAGQTIIPNSEFSKKMLNNGAYLMQRGHSHPSGNGVSNADIKNVPLYPSNVTLRVFSQGKYITYKTEK